MLKNRDGGDIEALDCLDIVMSIYNQEMLIKTILDGIKITMKKRAAVNIADVKPTPLEIDWTMSPTWEDKVSSTPLEMGLE